MRRARSPSDIPTLCKHPDLDATAACGICIVRVAGSNKMLRACCTPVEPDMEITTEDPEIIHVRRTVIEMILSRHPNECLTCGRNQNCELQTIAADFGLREICLDSIVPDLPIDNDEGRHVSTRASASPAAAASRSASRSRTSGP
jgi:predicted molibdopterin-dependent oxidoreductase YjgC